MPAPPDPITSTSVSTCMGSVMKATPYLIPPPQAGEGKESRRQRLALGFRQEWGRRQAQDIDHRNRERGVTEAPQIRDDPAGNDRAEPGDQPGRGNHQAR